MIAFYRVFVFLFCMTAIAATVAHDFSQPLLKVVVVSGMLLLLMTLILFSKLCADVHGMKDREDSFNTSFFTGEGTSLDLRNPRDRLGGMLDLGKFPVRDVGDRKFKADATKVCKNCKHIGGEDRICRMDDLSLEGITISAVGCQYWTLGLTVTESEHLPGPSPRNDPDGSPKNT